MSPHNICEAFPGGWGNKGTHLFSGNKGTKANILREWGKTNFGEQEI